MRTDSTGQLEGILRHTQILHQETTGQETWPQGDKDFRHRNSIARITTSFRGAGGRLQSGGLAPFHFESEHPIATFDTTKVSLKILVDSTYRSVATAPRVLQADSLSPRHFRIEFPWEYEQKYRVEIDTMAAIDIYGRPTRPFSQELM